MPAPRPQPEAVEWDDEDGPPPPDAFPPGWDVMTVPAGRELAEAASAVYEPKPAAAPPVAVVAEVPVEVPAADPAEPLPAPPDEPEVRLPSLYAAAAREQPGDQPAPRQITLLLRPSDDPERDRRRIKAVYGLLISFPGADRFTFQIFEVGRGHLIDFPNDTTRICPELLSRLRKVLGEDAWRIEAITFQ